MVKKFRELTHEERKRICNGCGPKGGFMKPPNFVFKLSCDHHDYNYYLGYREAHRFKADMQFLEAMRKQIKKMPLFRRPFLHIAAYVYYRAVRRFGKYCFHYGVKERALPIEKDIKEKI